MSTTATAITTRESPRIEDKADRRKWRERGLELAAEDAAYQAGIAKRQFAIGDWLVEGEEKWSRDAYKDAAEIFPQYVIETLRNFACVARAISTSFRNDVLPFKHHAVVTPLEATLQKKYLDQAADKDLKILGFKAKGRVMSASDLRKLISYENPKPMKPGKPGIVTFEWSGYKGSRELPSEVTEAIKDLSCVSFHDAECLKPVEVVTCLIYRALSELPDIVALLEKIRDCNAKVNLECNESERMKTWPGMEQANG